jgi:hypothetical protein
MELIHEDTSDDRHDVAAILQEQFEISAEQAPLDVRLQVRARLTSSRRTCHICGFIQHILFVRLEAVIGPLFQTLRSE